MAPLVVSVQLGMNAGVLGSSGERTGLEPQSILTRYTGWGWASQVVSVVKNSTTNAGDARNAGWIPGSGRSPGGGQGNPLQYSCLENPMDTEAWWGIVHSVEEELDRTEVN